MCFSPPSLKILREMVTVEQILTLSRAYESTQSAGGGAATPVNQIRSSRSSGPGKKFHKRSKGPPSSHELRSCFRCGRPDHLANEKNCPAVGKICNRCHKEGHFASVCNSRPDEHDKYGTIRGNPRRKLDKKSVNIVNVQQCAAESDDDEYAFSVSNGNSSGSTALTAGGVKLDMLIVSGASTNFIDHTRWESLKEKKIKCQLKKCDKKLDAYG